MTRARYVAQLTSRCAIQEEAIRRYAFEYQLGYRCANYLRIRALASLVAIIDECKTRTRDVTFVRIFIAHSYFSQLLCAKKMFL